MIQAQWDDWGSEIKKDSDGPLAITIGKQQQEGKEVMFDNDGHGLWIYTQRFSLGLSLWFDGETASETGEGHNQQKTTCMNATVCIVWQSNTVGQSDLAGKLTESCLDPFLNALHKQL